MNRRQYLGIAAGTLTAGIAGCEQRQLRTGPPVLENRPDAVYVPTHVDGMQHVATEAAGRLRVALSFARPHRFWLVTGTRVRSVTVERDDAVHLMVSVWDAETGIGLPASTATATVSRNGESVDERSLWSMLSQRMGVHFGDNVVLEGDGEYEVEVAYGPIESRLGGALSALDPGRRTVNFDLDYRRSLVEELGFEEIADRAGTEGAVDPMDMDMLPVDRLPAVENLPGRSLGSATSGDAHLIATVLDSPPTGFSRDGPYLAISLRTPHNQYPLPFASLSSGDGMAFRPAIDDTLGFHYGRVYDEAPEAVDVIIDAPPQLARHEGYETAFIDMDPVTLGDR